MATGVGGRGIESRARSARPRRTQAERTAETRGRILAAVVESLAEVGFQRTTAAEIARRAGVTWGAVQHHFGGKDGILRAVLEDSFARFATRMEDLPGSDRSLESRARGFVERAWEHFSGPHFRSTFEILQSTAGDPQAFAPELQQELLRAWDDVFRRLFPDARLPRRSRLLLGHYTVSTLTGMAVSMALEGGDRSLPREELTWLADTLVARLREET